MSIAADSHPPGEYYCPTCEKTYQLGDRCPADGTRLVKLKVPVDPFLGRELDGRYTILEKLGQGGMGAVYRGSQHGLGREVAIKVVSAHLVSEAEVIKRFLREAKLASKLAHPNAVAVLDFGQTDDGLFYLVMELVVGRTLDQVVKADKVFRPERVVRIGTQVCDALEGAHALQIVHRDLKPSNIMLLSQGRDLVKVLDFGLAKSVAPDQASTTMTNAGALLGTPAFMPPELALGHPCDGRADLYSLGCVLYLLGSGRLPFVAESAHELIALHGTEPAPPMAGVPPALGRVIDRLLAKEPKDRYQTAAETREALEAALDSRATPPPWDTTPSLGPFPSRTEDFAALQTSSPKSRRSGAEIDRLVMGDTMAAVSDTARHPTARTKRRWLVPALAGVAAIGVGAGVFVAMGGGKQHEVQPAPPPVVDVTPPPPPAPKPEPPPPPPPPMPEVKPEITTAPTPEAKPRPRPHPTIKKREPKVEAPPPPPPPAPPAGSGAAKKPALPF